ncbi:MAG: glycosyltransferase [Candidatus Heimdallarchaeota archaeon]
MRIGIFSDSWVPNLNGVVISIINEIMNLRKKHEFVVIVPKLKQSSRFGIEGIPIYELKSFPFPPYPGYNIALPDRNLRHAIRDEKLDFIHCHSPFSLGYAAVLSARLFNDLPLMNTYHTDLVKYSGHLIGGFQAKRFTRWFERFAWIYVRWFYKYSDVIVTPSKTLQQALSSHGVFPVYSLPNMLSNVFFSTPKKNEVEAFEEHIRDKFSIPATSRIVLYCGRVSYEKKLEVLLNAFKRIERELEDVYLLIIGDGPHLQMYRNLAKTLKLKQIAFTGFISHTKLPLAYRMGMFMVTPSDTETQGLTVIEAMSQGLPVIGVSGGGVMDYIENGTNGFLVPPGDDEALAKVIVRLLNKPELVSEFSRAATRTVKKFSRDGFITQLERAFQITISRHNGRD